MHFLFHGLGFVLLSTVHSDEILFCIGLPVLFLFFLFYFRFQHKLHKEILNLSTRTFLCVAL